jgi:hypothetical protein
MVLVDPTPLAQPVTAGLPVVVPSVNPLGDLAHFLFDPAHLIDLMVAVIQNLVGGLRGMAESIIEGYVFRTGNPTGPWLCGLDQLRNATYIVPAGCRFTENNVVQALYRMSQAMALATLTAILLYSLVRSIWERGYRARYTLKAILPRLLLVIAMVNFGLPLLQGLIDLNNSLVHAFWTFSLDGSVTDPKLWDQLVPGVSTPIPASEVFVFNLVGLLMVVLLVVLALTAIARNLLLVFLVGAAPLVFLGLLLPETHTYLLAWRRLLFTTIFMQAVQVLVLRVGLVFVFQDHHLVSPLYGLVAMLLVLKVPSALHAASKAESRLTMWAKHGAHAAQRAIEGHSPGGHPRVRAHPVAD